MTLIEVYSCLNLYLFCICNVFWSWILISRTKTKVVALALGFAPFNLATWQRYLLFTFPMLPSGSMQPARRHFLTLFVKAKFDKQHPVWLGDASVYNRESPPCYAQAQMSWHLCTVVLMKDIIRKLFLALFVF